MEVEWLVIGPSMSGKTSLVQSLLGIKGQNAESDEFTVLDAVQTVGVELEELSGGSKRRVVFREVGGKMRRLWNSYYGRCSNVLYVVDASDESGLAWAHTEYLRVIRHKDLIGKPVLVVFNKIDRPFSVGKEVLRELFDEMRACVCREEECAIIQGMHFISCISHDGIQDLYKNILALSQN
eukprot:TRINITY_DN332_c0_g2_i5.p1 TRINITY_DN332_c0_g2~~TRINITY_DN332_c0_g2_i5.p1  ORF type:complete len:181 (-),score=50.96 TRINITY_DN332_c0_g2_i5:118-660(-)